MKKILIGTLTLAFILSCSSNYKVRVETPSDWYKRNYEEIKAENGDNSHLPDVTGKLKNIKNDNSTINTDNNKVISNISSTNVYNENNAFAEALKNSKQIKLEKIEEKPVVVTPIVEEKNEFTEIETKLLAYIYSKVTETKDIVNELTLQQYELVKAKIGREQFLALAAKYIRDKNVNNYAYTTNIIVNQLRGK